MGNLKLGSALAVFMLLLIGTTSSFAEIKDEVIVYLDNDTTKRGTVVSKIPGEAVILKLNNGDLVVIKESNIIKIMEETTTTFTKKDLPDYPPTYQNMNVLGGPSLSKLNMSGPRVGMTFLTGRSATPRDEGGEWDYPVITQIGWQFEQRFFTTDGGMTGLTEIIPLIGGVDQNNLKLTVATLFGARAQTGFEFAAGPLISLPLESEDNVNSSFIFAVGLTTRQGNVFFPFNLAVVPHKDGTRFTFTVGWNVPK